MGNWPSTKASYFHLPLRAPQGHVLDRQYSPSPLMFPTPLSTTTKTSRKGIQELVQRGSGRPLSNLNVSHPPCFRQNASTPPIGGLFRLLKDVSRVCQPWLAFHVVVQSDCVFIYLAFFIVEGLSSAVGELFVRKSSFLLTAVNVPSDLVATGGRIVYRSASPSWTGCLNHRSGSIIGVVIFGIICVVAK